MKKNHTSTPTSYIVSYRTFDNYTASIEIPILSKDDVSIGLLEDRLRKLRHFKAIFDRQYISR